MTLHSVDVVRKRRMLWARTILLAFVVVAFILAVKFFPLKDYFKLLFNWVTGLGVWGPVVVAASYVVACLLLIPGSILTLGAGFLFKVLVGTVTVSIGSTLGASAAFLVGRTIARGWVNKKISANPRFSVIDKAVGKEGFKIVLLTRLSPVFPFVFLNYAFGLTRVRFRDYFLASWIGMLPGTIMYVYFGSGLRSLTDVLGGEVGGSAVQRVLFWVGLLVTIVVVILATRIARRALKAAIEIKQEKL